MAAVAVVAAAVLTGPPTAQLSLEVYESAHDAKGSSTAVDRDLAADLKSTYHFIFSQSW